MTGGEWFIVAAIVFVGCLIAHVIEQGFKHQGRQTERLIDAFKEVARQEEIKRSVLSDMRATAEGIREAAWHGKTPPEWGD